MLTYADVCRLTYADVCVCMKKQPFKSPHEVLTYTDVCWCMQADVC
jgi:hypothetical protein